MKFLKKPLVFFLTFMMIAMTVTHDILYAADDTRKVTSAVSTVKPEDLSKVSTTTVEEVLVKGTQDDKKKSYKAEKVGSPKYTAPLKDIPQTIAVVPQAVIEEQGATTLRQALSNVPGISIQAGEGGTPAGDQMSIRGFSARNDLFIDNVRDFGGYTRDNFNFEQVEVTKGPSSSYVGRGSTGGSVNLVSKTPQADPFYRGTYGIGTDEYMRSTVDLNQPLNGIGIQDAAFRLNALLHKADVPGRKVADNKRWGIAPSLAFGMDTATRVTLSFFHLYQNNNPDYGIPWVPNTITHPSLVNSRDYAAPVDYSNYYGLSERDYEKTTTDLGTVRIEHDFNDTFTLRNQFRYGRNYRDSIITSPRFTTNNAITEIRRTDWKSRDQIDAILTNQTDLISKFETWEREHTLVTGFEVTREDETNFNRIARGPASANTGLFNPNPADPYTDNIGRDGDKAQATAKSFALYGFDTIKVAEQWEVNGGLRYDYFNMNFTPIITGQSLRRDDNLLSWNSGIVYHPLPIGSIYFGYGTSVNPSSESLTASTTGSSLMNITSDPERSRTFELGTKWDLFQKRMALTAAVFQTDKTNARTEDPNDANDIVVLEGNQRVRGLELGSSGNITEDWKVFGAYTYLNSDITKSKSQLELGKELANTPRHTFNLWSTYDLPFGIQVGAGMNYVSYRFNSNANTRKAPAYLIYNAMLAYQLTKNLTLRLNLYNLGNQKYIDSLSGGHFVPGAGRSGTLTSEFNF